MAEIKPLKVLSLFDGISCGMVALERAGIPVERYVAYEIDPYAIKISQKNYPQIEHCGDVTTADFTQYEGFDLVIGGSPCTFWSVARLNTGKNGTVERETEPKGLGYELFMQFVRAIKETKAKYFLYENNFSISQNIKDEITKQLGVQPIMINSGLVSAQNRKRMYWTNIPNVKMPNDKNIRLCDVVDFSNHEFRDVGKWCFELWGGKPKIEGLKTTASEKAHTLTTSKTHPMNYYLNKEKTKYCNLTVKDWEKIQTLPVGYVDLVDVPQGAKYKAIGNGWTVDVIAHILKGLEEDDNG